MTISSNQKYEEQRRIDHTKALKKIKIAQEIYDLEHGVTEESKAKVDDYLASF